MWFLWAKWATSRPQLAAAWAAVAPPARCATSGLPGREAGRLPPPWLPPLAVAAPAECAEEVRLEAARWRCSRNSISMRTSSRSTS